MLPFSKFINERNTLDDQFQQLVYQYKAEGKSDVEALKLALQKLPQAKDIEFQKTLDMLAARGVNNFDGNNPLFGDPGEYMFGLEDSLTVDVAINLAEQFQISGISRRLMPGTAVRYEGLGATVIQSFLDGAFVTLRFNPGPAASSAIAKNGVDTITVFGTDLQNIVPVV
jgi:hypothetical protein